MTAPRTLLDMAGARLAPARWQDAVLLLIDHQREYDAGGGLELHGIAGAKAGLVRLLAAARVHQAPVIHVAHHGRSGGGLFDPEGAMSAFMPEAAPVDGEVVVIKALPNAFSGTSLQEALTAAGRKEIIVAGFMTHMCVSSTVRAFADRGYRPPTVVAGACATRALPDGCQGPGIPADVVHQVALSELADRFAVVVTSVEEIGD
ncbi:MAG: cysteine hydrolase [Rhodospirillales bacterium]|nr:MAG: cysteine hydrolase [Rhodospirillales bacterium]